MTSISDNSCGLFGCISICKYTDLGFSVETMINKHATYLVLKSGSPGFSACMKNRGSEKEKESVQKVRGKLSVSSAILGMISGQSFDAGFL